MSSAAQPGVCRHCECTETNACRLTNGEPCCWIDAERKVCSNPACIQAEGRRVREEKNAVTRKHGDRFVGWGKGAIDIELRRDARRRKRRRAA